MDINGSEPLIYTNKGNLPVHSLRTDVQWLFEHADNGDLKTITFVQEWWDENGESVKRAVHVYSYQALPAIGAAQGKVN